MDWWSLGVLMYECLEGTSPFHDEVNEVTYEKVLQGRDSLPFPKAHFHDDAASAVRAFLHPRPAMRLGGARGTNGMGGLRKHACFRGIDFEALALGKSPVPKLVTKFAQDAGGPRTTAAAVELWPAQASARTLLADSTAGDGSVSPPPPQPPRPARLPLVVQLSHAEETPSGRNPPATASERARQVVVGAEANICPLCHRWTQRCACTAAERETARDRRHEVRRVEQAAQKIQQSFRANVSNLRRTSASRSRSSSLASTQAKPKPKPNPRTQTGRRRTLTLTIIPSGIPRTGRAHEGGPRPRQSSGPPRQAQRGESEYRQGCGRL